MQPSYYAIIPATVRYDKALPPAAKLLYGEITALSNVHGYCYAGNAYFAELYGVDKDTVSGWLSKLSKANHVKVVWNAKTNERKIFVIEPLRQNADTSTTNIVQVYEENSIPVGEKSDTSTTKDRHNNTVNTTGNRESASSDAPPASPGVNEPPISEPIPVQVVTGEPQKQKRVVTKKDDKSHYFRDSPFYDRQAFILALSESEYNIYDLAHYHETVKNWADQKDTVDRRKTNWIATARGFMLRDEKDGKVKMKPKNNYASQPQPVGQYVTYQDLLKPEFR